MRARFINEIKRTESVTKGMAIGVANVCKGYYALDRNFPDLIDNPDLNRPVHEVIESFETNAKYDVMKTMFIEMKIMLEHFAHDNLDDLTFLNTEKYAQDSLARTENAVDDERLDSVLDEIFDDAVVLADEDITTPDVLRLILSWKITWNESMQAGQFYVHDLIRNEHVQGVIARFK
jgi:hypothetical protein